MAAVLGSPGLDRYNWTIKSHVDLRHQLPFDVWRRGPVSFVPDMDFSGDGGWQQCHILLGMDTTSA